MIFIEPSESHPVLARAHNPFEIPEPHRAAFTPRGRALHRWIGGQVELIQTPVTVPDGGPQLSIAQPTSKSRQQLFDNARACQEQQLPYWADVWPSGLTLAAFALRQREFLAGKSVLEIGSGLGSTAVATLTAGARLLALDYSPLALALCRYNALLNVGAAPRALPINWRHPNRRALSRLDAAGPFPVIMAADVLYESRDIEPLIVLIDRLLAWDGELWLTEPGRKVAARFLDTLATRAWRFTSHTTSYRRPDGDTDPIHIHVLRRDLTPDWRYGSVGGWRI